MLSRRKVQVVDKENIESVPPGSPVIVCANHIGDNDALAIRIAFSEFDRPIDPSNPNTRRKTIIHSSWHEQNGKLTYRKWVEASRNANINMLGVVQAYRGRVINPDKLTDGAVIPSSNFRDIINTMLGPSALSFLFPSGTRSADRTLLPAEASLGMIILLAAQKNIDLHLVPLGIIPQDRSSQSKQFSLQQKMKIVFGKPTKPQDLIDDADRLMSECNVNPIDRSRQLQQGFIAHALMLRLPLPQALMGVYDPTHPLYKEVLMGKVKIGMENTSNGGYKVLLVRSNPNTTSETKWIPA